MATCRPGKPHLEQDQIEGQRAPGPSPGWSHEHAGNDVPREMATAPTRRGHRTRLIGRLDTRPSKTGPDGARLRLFRGRRRVASARSSPPELLRREARAFSHRLELRPAEIRMPHPRAEAAVGARSHVLATDELRIPHQPVGDQMQVLDEVCCVTDDARDQNFAEPALLGQPDTRAGHAAVVLDDVAVIALHPRLDKVVVVAHWDSAQLVLLVD